MKNGFPSGSRFSSLYAIKRNLYCSFARVENSSVGSLDSRRGGPSDLAERPEVPAALFE